MRMFPLVAVVVPSATPLIPTTVSPSGSVPVTSTPVTTPDAGVPGAPSIDTLWYRPVEIWPVAESQYTERNTFVKLVVVLEDWNHTNGPPFVAPAVTSPNHP